jgi:hypothetical protein
MRWNVFLTIRDAAGGLRKEFVGAFQENELPDVLEETFRQAGEEHGGVQVSRPLPSVTAPLSPA